MNPAPPRRDDVMPFLRAIVDRPTDNLPRLIFSDWLEEHGYEEAAFMERWRATRPHHDGWFTNLEWEWDLLLHCFTEEWEHYG